MENAAGLPFVSHTRVDHIPVIWLDPESRRHQNCLAIWLPWLGGNKDEMKPYLADLVKAGFVALSFDPWQHGERGTESNDQLRERVFSNFYRHMWPILGHTTEDVLRVIDWAIETLGVTSKVYIGGISMGGDVSIAIAGLDSRIQCVAAIVATPDWLRPGMNIQPGEPDSYARLFYERLNPLTHLSAYFHCPAITFECGAQDKHVPPDGALRFREALKVAYQSCDARLRVNLHPGVAHQTTESMWRNCLEWFESF